MAQWGAKKLNAYNASGLVASVEALSKKAGIKAPEVYLIDRIPGMGNPGKYGAGALGKHAIVLTDGILELYENRDLNGPTDKRLEAVLGHELYHNKGANTQLAHRLLPPLLMPIIAMAGYHIYRKAKQKKEKEEQAKSVETEGNALSAEIKKENPPESHSFFDKVITFAKYLAMGALGFLAGKFIQSKLSMFHEYEADAFGKKLTGGDPQPLIEGLQLITDKMHDVVRTEGYGEELSEWKKFMHRTFPSHPPTEKRQTALAL